MQTEKRSETITKKKKENIAPMTVRRRGDVELFIHFLWAFLSNSLCSMASIWTMGEWKWMTKKKQLKTTNRADDADDDANDSKNKYQKT